MIDLAELARSIDPDQTTLFLGAGAGKDSGAPLASDLELLLRRHVERDHHRSLPEKPLDHTAAVIERNFGRNYLLAKVRGELVCLEPNDQLKPIAQFDWKAIFTTNYDLLIERAFAIAKRPLVPIRHNKDFSEKRRDAATVEYFKMHGCISDDYVDGKLGRVVLTELDYDNCFDYRESLVSAFQTYVLAGATLIVGHSLRDRYLTDILRKAIEAHRGGTANHAIYLLGRDSDTDFLEIQEQRGIRCGVGTFGDLLRQMATVRPRTITHAYVSNGNRCHLPPKLSRTVIDVPKAMAEAASPRKLFAGHAASYGDIVNELTFPRTLTRVVVEAVNRPQYQFCSLCGPSGCGKTTIARMAAVEFVRAGLSCWELEPLATLAVNSWEETARLLQNANMRAAIIIPDCASQLQNINDLIGRLLDARLNSLIVVVTADSSQWRHRIKSRGFATNGRYLYAGRLDAAEIRTICDDYVRRIPVQPHINPRFLGLSREDQEHELTKRCKQDVFVSLKFLFNNRGMDDILLEEYNTLRDSDNNHVESASDIYKWVSVIEAAGSLADRQVIHRLTSFAMASTSQILERLDGIVEEETLHAGIGSFVWRTRHSVIAEAVASRLVGSPSEWRDHIRHVASKINPALQHELAMFRRMLSAHFASKKLGDKVDKIALYEELIKKFPGERFLWHRLISTYLAHNDLKECEHSLDQAFDTVGLDPPLARYRIKLEIQRLKHLSARISADERLAGLRRAMELSKDFVRRFSDDKYQYLSFAEIARDLLEAGADDIDASAVLQELANAEEDIMDPDFGELLKGVRAELERFALHR